MWIRDRGRPGQPADRGKGTFTLNSNQPVSGAGSGIVARPDRVRGVDKRQKGEVGGLQGQRLPLGSWVLPTSCGGGERIGEGGWGEGEYWQIFMGCRCSICRCLIELCDVELGPSPDLHQDNPRQWFRGQRCSPGQNEQPVAGGTLDV